MLSGSYPKRIRKSTHFETALDGEQNTLAQEAQTQQIRLRLTQESVRETKTTKLLYAKQADLCPW